MSFVALNNHCHAPARLAIEPEPRPSPSPKLHPGPHPHPSPDPSPNPEQTCLSMSVYACSKGAPLRYPREIWGDIGRYREGGAARLPLPLFLPLTLPLSVPLPPTLALALYPRPHPHPSSPNPNPRKARRWARATRRRAGSSAAPRLSTVARATPRSRAPASTSPATSTSRAACGAVGGTGSRRPPTSMACRCTSSSGPTRPSATTVSRRRGTEGRAFDPWPRRSASHLRRTPFSLHTQARWRAGSHGSSDRGRRTRDLTRHGHGESPTGNGKCTAWLPGLCPDCCVVSRMCCRVSLDYLACLTAYSLHPPRDCSEKEIQGTYLTHHLDTYLLTQQKRSNFRPRFTPQRAVSAVGRPKRLGK